MKKRIALAVLAAGLLAACGGGGPEVRASAELGDSSPVVEAGEQTTTTKALAQPAPITTAGGTAPVTATTVRATTTATTAVAPTSDLAAAESAKQAKESADRAEGAALRAEEAAEAATSTTTTTQAVTSATATTQAPTTTTTAPKVYGWVEVARFEIEPSDTSLAADVTLTGGAILARDPYSALHPRALRPTPSLWLGDHVACRPGEAWASDCVWAETFSAGDYTLHLDNLGVTAPKLVTVEEWRVIG